MGGQLMPGREMSCKYQMRMLLREAVLILILFKVHILLSDIEVYKISEQKPQNIYTKFWILSLSFNNSVSSVISNWYWSG